MPRISCPNCSEAEEHQAGRTPFLSSFGFLLGEWGWPKWCEDNVSHGCVLTQPCGLHMLASSSHAVMMPGEHGTDLTSVRSHVLRPLSRRRRRGCFLFQCARDTANPIGHSDPSFTLGTAPNAFMSSEESNPMNQMQHPALESIHLFLQALARGTASDNYSIHHLEESLSSGCSTQTPFMFLSF